MPANIWYTLVFLPMGDIKTKNPEPQFYHMFVLWSLTLNEEQRLEVFVNRMLGKIFGL